MLVGGRDVALRPVAVDDEALLDALFASTRAAELAGLPAPMRTSFVQLQRTAQERAWAAASPGLQRWVVEVDGVPCGRLYVDDGSELTVVDVALLPAYRGSGIGGRLIQDVQRLARERETAVVLSVEHTNPARRLYERLGFTETDRDDVRAVLRWDARP